MRTPGAKKKVDKEKPVEEKTQNVVEPPKNLFVDKSEEDQNTVSSPKEEEGKTDEQKQASTPTVEIKPTPSVGEVLSPAAQETPPPTNPPPPISVPIDRISPTYSSDQPKSNKFMWIILVIVIGAVVAGGAWLYFSRVAKKEEPKTLDQATTEPLEKEVSPTIAIAIEEAKLDKYEVKVLNGSGVVGEASNLQKTLEEGGFVVSETGNADNYDYTDTIIQTKASVEKNFLEELKSLMAKSYTLGKDETLEATDSSDVIVIFGSKKAEEE